MSPSTRLRLVHSFWLFSVIACGGNTETNANATGGEDSGGTEATSDGDTTTTGNGNNAAVTATTSPGFGTTGTGGTTGSGCPGVEPPPTSNCPLEGQSCAYVNCYAPNYRDDHTLTCRAGAWVVTADTKCETPQGTCPASLPAVGTLCNPALTPGPCNFIDACGALRSRACVAGLWQEAATGDGAPAPGAGGTTSTTGSGVSAPPSCPNVRPSLGSSCCPSLYPPWCDYAPAGAAGAAGASFLIAPTGSGGAGELPDGFGGVGTTGAVPINIDCYTCGPNMVWQTSLACIK